MNEQIANNLKMILEEDKEAFKHIINNVPPRKWGNTIDGMMNWSRQPQGHEYWSKLYSKLYYKGGR